ncbi:MAG: HEAT repeat domain-containing protein, partial [Myxococcales bacterium]|nr:HEAT repeat domain-containing protein [Myxococcales bacterium]
RRDVGPRVLSDGTTRQRYDEPQLLASMGRAAKCADAELRRRAAKALRDVDDAAAEEILAALVEDREPVVRVEAAEALAFRAQVVEAASIETLSTTLRAARRELVLPAAVGLAGRGRPESFQALLLVFKAGEQNERERALLALGTLGDRRALEEIEPLVDTRAEVPDEDRALAPAAAEALGRMLPALQRDEAASEDAQRVRETVERLVREGDYNVRVGALRGLRSAGDARSRTLIERVASDRFESHNVRVVALQQLGLLADAASEGVLAELLDDGQSGVRDSALAALERIFPEDKTRVALLALGSKHSHISAPAASYLARRGDPTTLVARLGEVRGDEVRRRLRHGLVRRGACPVPELESLLGGGDEAPRAEAAWIAGASGNRALAPAVVKAVQAAEQAWREARQRASKARAAGGNGDAVTAAANAWHASLWAARQLEADVSASARTALTAREHPTAVRREAIRYLGAHAGSGGGAGDVEQVMVSALSDPDAEIRAAAASAVSRLEPARGAAILGQLAAPDAAALVPVVRAALPVAGEDLLGDERGRQLALPVCLGEGRVEQLVAIAQAEGKDPARLAAIAALGRIGGDAARAALQAILARDGEQAAIKAATYRALRRLQRAEAKTYAEDQDQERGTSRYAGYSGGGYDYDDYDDDDDDDDDWDDDDDDDEDWDDED